MRPARRAGGDFLAPRAGGACGRPGLPGHGGVPRRILIAMGSSERGEPLESDHGRGRLRRWAGEERLFLA